MQLVFDFYAYLQPLLPFVEAGTLDQYALDDDGA